MAPARGKSRPSGQRRGPTAPGGNKFPSPDQKSFHTSSTPTTRGRKCRSSRRILPRRVWKPQPHRVMADWLGLMEPGSIPPRRVWKPQPHWVIADWLGLMEPAHGESHPSGQRRGPAAPGEDNSSSPGEEIFHISTTPTTRGRRRTSPGPIPPRRVWKPQPHRVIVDWPGVMAPARDELSLIHI